MEKWKNNGCTSNLPGAQSNCPVDMYGVPTIVLLGQKRMGWISEFWSTKREKKLENEECLVSIAFH